MSEVTKLQDWKSRYLELAEQQAAEKSGYQQVEQLLCRTIIRLTLAAGGLDPVLDPHLKRLRDAIRKGVHPDLEEQLNALSEALIRAGGEPGGQVENSGQELFRRLLEQTRLNGSRGRRLQKLGAEMLAAPEKVTDDQLDELLRLIGSERVSEGRSSGLFGRFFSDKEAAAESGNDSPPNQLLLSLLEELSWPGQLSEDIAQLAERLGKDAEPTAWTEVIRNLTHLMSSTLGDVQSEMQATEGFLQQLTSRLQEIDQHVSSSQDRHQQSLASGDELSETVKTQVGGIQQSMRSATSLQQMTSHINRHLDAIHEHVESHVAAEAERHRQAAEVEQRLRERLGEVEGETDELQRKMADAHHRATTDTVTGLPNRLAYEERLRQEFARWRRFQEPLSLLVWDIDDFKRINDRFGHSSGDKALRVIGQLLRRERRETDLVARYGGEEFIMLLAGVDLKGALRLANDTRNEIRESGFHSGGKKVEVTISCGLSEFRQGDTPEAVFDRADKALYKAKGNGKNCCISL